MDRSRYCAASVSLVALVIAALSATCMTSCGRRVLIAPEARTPSHNAAALPIGTSDDAEDEVMVILAHGTDASDFGNDYGATLIETGPSGSAVYRPGSGETPASLAERMSSDSRIVTSEPNGILETAESRQQSFAFDDGNGSAWSFSDQPATLALGLDDAHVTTRGAGVLVAILDTGAELDHPALSARIAGGWDFVSGDADPSDVGDGLDNDGDGRIDEAQGHGSHVAGILALTAPEARLLIVRVLDADGRGDMLSVASGIQYAIDRGARVINLSLGMLSSSDAIQHLLEQAEARGIVCVASAGNWGDEEPEEYPARSSHVIAVGAVDAAKHAASFTSFGSFVDLCGPGVDVRSAYRNGGYALWSGTSMAAPFVAGASALLLSLHPHWESDDVLRRLEETAGSIDVSANPQMGGELGAGALDIAAAVEPDRLPDDVPIVDAQPKLRRP